jgi:dihydroorotase
MREEISRRTFLGALAGSALLPQQSRYEILIRGGEVRDPSQGLSRRADLGITDGRVAAIEPHIPASRGLKIIEAKGAYVTPGLVDLHTHLGSRSRFQRKP